MIKRISIIALLLLVSGCYGGKMLGNFLDQERPTDLPTTFGGSMSPRPLFMSNLPGGDDSYSTGFREGCQTTISYGEGMLRMYDFAYDIDRGLKDKEYYAGYRAGTVYCTYFADVDPL